MCRNYMRRIPSKTARVAVCHGNNKTWRVSMSYQSRTSKSDNLGGSLFLVGYSGYQKWAYTCRYMPRHDYFPARRTCQKGFDTIQVSTRVVG